MSKNKHMLSEMITVIDPEGRTRGAVSLVQGAYGRRGNLELVACDRTDGLWVFWFNADLPTDPCDTPDVPAGTWSRGLPFATGARYAQAAILQSTLGPDHLEVLALRADGTLESWYWSPGPGFQRRATDVATGVARFAAAHADGRITAAVDGPEGRRAVASTGETYPDRTWTTVGDGPRLGGEDALRLLAGAGIDPAGIVDGTVASAPSTRGGGATEIVWRDAEGRLLHVAV